MCASIESSDEHHFDVTIYAKPRRPLRETSAWQAYGASRYAILFFALLLTLAVMPAAPAIGLPPVLIKLLLAASLLAAVMPNATRQQPVRFLRSDRCAIGAARSRPTMAICP